VYGDIETGLAISYIPPPGDRVVRHAILEPGISEQEEFAVGFLDVLASFHVSSGHGAGPAAPETWVVIDVRGVGGFAGQAKVINFPDPPDPDARKPVHVFVVLSAMFGARQINLRIVEVKKMDEAGVYGLRVEAPADLGVKLEEIRPSTLGIYIDDVVFVQGQGPLGDFGRTMAYYAPAAPPM
jgi:hypothetical protein